MSYNDIAEIDLGFPLKRKYQRTKYRSEFGSVWDRNKKVQGRNIKQELIGHNVSSISFFCFFLKIFTGACPPCPITVRSPCHCGASEPQMMRCSAKFWSCGKMCGRVLSCKQHKCPQKCHPGEFPNPPTPTHNLDHLLDCVEASIFPNQL